MNDETNVQTTETETKPETKPEESKKPKVANRMTEEELLADYSHVIPGSLTFLAVENKQAVKIKCKTEGCERTRTVRTSDLWQVEHCEACTRKERRERARERRKAKKAEATVSAS